MVHIQAVNFLYRGAYLDERYPDVAKVGNGNVRISRTPMDFGFARNGSSIRGQTRFGGRMLNCPPRAIDPRF